MFDINIRSRSPIGTSCSASTLKVGCPIGTLGLMSTMETGLPVVYYCHWNLAMEIRRYNKAITTGATCFQCGRHIHLVTHYTLLALHTCIHIVFYHECEYYRVRANFVYWLKIHLCPNRIVITHISVCNTTTSHTSVISVCNRLTVFVLLMTSWSTEQLTLEVAHWSFPLQ